MECFNFIIYALFFGFYLWYILKRTIDSYECDYMQILNLYTENILYWEQLKD